MAGTTNSYRVFIDNSVLVGQETIAGIQTQGFEYGVYVSNDLETNDLDASAITANSVSANTLSGNLTATNISTNNLSVSGNITGNLNLNGNVTGTFAGAVRATGAAPTTSTSSGTVGDIRVASGHIYVCVATNTWQRAELTTF